MTVTNLMDAVGDYLVAQGKGVYLVDGVGTLVLGSMPESPDSLAAVYEGLGQPPQFTMGSGGIAVDNGMIQITVRGAPDIYTTPRDRALDIRTALASVVGETVDGFKIMRMEPLGRINPLGVDKKGRWLFSMNFRCLM